MGITVGLGKFDVVGIVAVASEKSVGEEVGTTFESNLVVSDGFLDGFVSD